MFLSEVKSNPLLITLLSGLFSILSIQGVRLIVKVVLGLIFWVIGENQRLAGIRSIILAVSAMVDMRMYIGRSPWFEETSGATNQKLLSIWAET